MRHALVRLVPVLLIAVVASGCAAAMSFKKGQTAARQGDWDAAVAHYRTAVQEDPDKPEYKIALERAMLDAALMHAAAGKTLEEHGQLDAAVREFRRASEYDPSNRQLAAHVADLDQRIRDLIEASRPRPKIEAMRDQARRMSAEPILNPASREPLDLHFANASLRDILKFVGDATGINVTFTSDYHDPPAYSVQLSGITLEQALQQVLSANGLFYKVINERTILIIPDTAQNRARYEEMVVRTFYLSHADAQDVVNILNTIMRVPGVPLVPAFVPNKTQNSITVRAAAPLVAIMERLIQSNDRPPAEIVLDLQIMEVNRTRAKQFGLDLSQYQVTGVFSPEVAPSGGTASGTGGTSGGGTTSGGATGTIAPPFNLNTITRGISAADFYLAVPTAIVRFLETDQQTKLVAKPQLRGQEGEKISLNLGDEIPVAQTTFGSIGGAGSLATTPVSSYQYKPVGIIVEVTPRVTFDGDVVLELTVENSALGQDVNIAGQNFPSFATRKVTTKIRLRDGESTLLAGLLREDERRNYKGFPGLMHLPVFRQLFTSNDLSSGQTDIVILMTPHIVRGHELTQQDINPVYIGSQQNLGLTGPPPLIAAPATDSTSAPPVPANPQNGTTAQPSPGPSGTLTQPGVLPPPAPAPPPAAAEPAPQPQAGQAPPAIQPEPAPVAEPGASPVSAGASDVRLLVTAPGTEFRMGGGPYTVPISVSSGLRVTTLTVTITYNPAVLKVRSVQPGTFMRQGGVDAQFTQQIDAVNGRVDMTVARGADVVGATGSGLVAAVLFDPVAAGATTIGAAGSATGPGGAALTVQTTPTAVTVR